MELKIELSAFIEMITDAHMAGQHDAGCPHASYGNARAYYTHEVENKIKNLSERSEPPHQLLGEVLELANSHSYTTTITPNYIGNQPYTKKIIHYDVLCKIIDDIQRKHFA